MTGKERSNRNISIAKFSFFALNAFWLYQYTIVEQYDRSERDAAGLKAAEMEAMYFTKSNSTNKSAATAKDEHVADQRLSENELKMAMDEKRRISQMSIDILSIASLERVELLKAQFEGYSAHPAVRNVFNVTELDDFDKGCFNLTREDAYAISRHCKRRNPQHSWLQRYLRNIFAREQWLAKKKNPVGWICAQPRFQLGLYKVMKHYHETSSFPDYLIMADDDTYFNLNLFEEYFSKKDPNTPKVHAGCLVRWPIHQINFTFPWGGYGTVINKGALRKLQKPINCGANAKHRTYPICNYLRKNLIGEASFYIKDGMSLIELMQAYVEKSFYSNYRNWTGSEGFCMHSDWFIGFFINFYDVSTHDAADKYWDDVRQERIDPILGSYIYRTPTGQCLNEMGMCGAEAMICHHMNGTSFAKKFRETKQLFL